MLIKSSNWAAIHRQEGRDEIQILKDRAMFKKKELKKEIKERRRRIQGGNRKGITFQLHGDWYSAKLLASQRNSVILAYLDQ